MPRGGLRSRAASETLADRREEERRDAEAVSSISRQELTGILEEFQDRILTEVSSHISTQMSATAANWTNSLQTFSDGLAEKLQYVPERSSETLLRRRLDDITSTLKYNAVEIQSFAEKLEIQAERERYKHLQYPIEDMLNSAYDKINEAEHKKDRTRKDCIKQINEKVDLLIKTIMPLLMLCNINLARQTRGAIESVTNITYDLESIKNQEEDILLNCSFSLQPFECIEETSTRLYDATKRLVIDVKTNIANAMATYDVALETFDNCAKPYLDEFRKMINKMVVCKALNCVNK